MSSPVRDVAMNPLRPNTFAVAYENGTLSIWDASASSSTPVSSITDMGAFLLSLDWHPTDAHVIACGTRDKGARIWHTLNASRPLYTVHTSNSCGRVSWRPGRPYQLATSATLIDTCVNVWNVQEPYMPKGQLLGHKVRNITIFMYYFL